MPKLCSPQSSGTHSAKQSLWAGPKQEKLPSCALSAWTIPPVHQARGSAMLAVMRRRRRKEGRRRQRRRAPAGDANVAGVEGAAVQAQEVQQQHAQVALQLGRPVSACARGVQQQEGRHHHQKRVRADAA